jgi:hypothetical protein
VKKKKKKTSLYPRKETNLRPLNSPPISASLFVPLLPKKIANAGMNSQDTLCYKESQITFGSVLCVINV